MANWMFTPEQVRELIRVHLLPPGLRVVTTYDAVMDGVIGRIDDGFPLGLGVDFKLDPGDLIISGDQLLQRLRDRLQMQIDEIAGVPAEEPFDLDATG